MTWDDCRDMNIFKGGIVNLTSRSSSSNVTAQMSTCIYLHPERNGDMYIARGISFVATHFSKSKISIRNLVWLYGPCITLHSACHLCNVYRHTMQNLRMLLYATCYPTKHAAIPQNSGNFPSGRQHQNRQACKCLRQ